MENRKDYRSKKGLVGWWSKDGAWHIAIHYKGREGTYWTKDNYVTKKEAIQALEGT
jgi:hypothetical protein